MPERIVSGEQDAADDSLRHVTVVELASAAGHGAVVDSEQVTGGSPSAYHFAHEMQTSQYAESGKLADTPNRHGQKT